MEPIPNSDPKFDLNSIRILTNSIWKIQIQSNTHLVNTVIMISHESFEGWKVCDLTYPLFSFLYQPHVPIRKQMNIIHLICKECMWSYPAPHWSYPEPNFNWPTLWSLQFDFFRVIKKKYIFFFIILQFNINCFSLCFFSMLPISYTSNSIIRYGS